MRFVEEVASNFERRVEAFHYEPLHNSASNIRLLTIQPGNDNDQIICTLNQATLHHPYTCLSYCWGPDQDHRQILVNGKSFLVRPNLHAFLAAARRYSFHQPMWIDALCINQADNNEKSQQVQIMGHIYTKAVKTIVWLGLSLNDCQKLPGLEQFVTSSPEEWEIDAWVTTFGEQCMVKKSANSFYDRIKKGVPTTRHELIQSALHEGMSGNSSYGPILDEFHPSWQRLLSHWHDVVNADGLLHRIASVDYWQRTWIIQELMLSAQTLLLSPPRYVGVKELLPLLVNIIFYMKGRHRSHSDESQALDLESSFTPGKIHIALAIRLTASSLCSDVRDRVFAIVSLVKNGDKFKIDYNQAVDQLLASVIRFHIQDRGSDLLIKRVLPALLEYTAATLEVRAPRLNSLPEVSTFLNGYNDCAGIGRSFFWASRSPSAYSDLVSIGTFDCSFCLPIEIYGRWGILEFLYKAEFMSCYKDAFWWTRSNGHWRCKEAGVDADDLD